MFLFVPQLNYSFQFSKNSSNAPSFYGRKSEPACFTSEQFAQLQSERLAREAEGAIRGTFIGSVSS